MQTGEPSQWQSNVLGSNPDAPLEQRWIKNPLHTDPEPEMKLQDQSKNYIATKLHNTGQAWLGLLWSSLAVATTTSKHLPPRRPRRHTPRDRKHIAHLRQTLLPAREGRHARQAARDAKDRRCSCAWVALASRTRQRKLRKRSSLSTRSLIVSHRAFRMTRGTAGCGGRRKSHVTTRDDYIACRPG
jgi:hypothetical protein